MKSFKEYLLESKARFIRKNKNLTKDQQEEIVKFIDSNDKAAKVVNDEFGWMKNAINMTYDDYYGIMMRFKSGRKAQRKRPKVRCQKNIRGLTHEEDYLFLQTNSKYYCCYIPFFWETAQKFNTDKYIGECKGDWCVGSTLSKSEWVNHVLNNGEVPVYVVGGEGRKVVAMIQEGNRSVDIWDEDNDTPNAVLDNFDAKKILLDSKKKKLYDMIRNDIYAKDEDNNGKEIGEQRKSLHDEIKSIAQEVYDNYKKYKKDVKDYMKKAIDYYKNKKSDKKGILLHYEIRRDEATKAFNSTNNDFDTAKFEGQLYTRVELIGIVAKLQQSVDHMYIEVDNDAVDDATMIEDLENILDDDVPYDEEDHGTIESEVEDLEMDKVFTDHNHFPEWDVYDEYHNELYLNDDNYGLFLNQAIEHGGDFQKFKEYAIDFITDFAGRSNDVTDEEVYQIFEDSAMYA